MIARCGHYWGSIDSAKWMQLFVESNSTSLPRLFLVTAKGDPLKDGGHYFKQVYDKVIEQVEATVHTERQSQTKYIETSSGHAGFYSFELPVYNDLMEEWSAEMRKVHSNRQVIDS